MPEFYTTQEIADMLKITEKKVRDYILKGRLKAFSLTGVSGSKRGPRALRITQSAVDEFIKENEVVLSSDSAQV